MRSAICRFFSSRMMRALTTEARAMIAAATADTTVAATETARNCCAAMSKANPQNYLSVVVGAALSNLGERQVRHHGS